MEQLELFPMNDVEVLSEKVNKIEKSSDSVRRSVYARVDKMEKMLVETQKKYEELCLFVNLQYKEILTRYEQIT